MNLFLPFVIENPRLTVTPMQGLPRREQHTVNLASDLAGVASPDVLTGFVWVGDEWSAVPSFRSGYLIVREPPGLNVNPPDGRHWRLDGGWLYTKVHCQMPADFDLDSRGILAVVTGTCGGPSNEGTGAKPEARDDISFFNMADHRRIAAPSGFAARMALAGSRVRREP